MTQANFVITTGLSIGLMDALDTYRSRSVQLINDSQFPTDVAMALRQQVDATIDTTIDALSSNPRQPEVLITPVQPELPNFTIPEPPVFIIDPTPEAPVVPPGE